MSTAADPYYNRKQVPDEFIDGVGYTGMSAGEEYVNRERKYSRDGRDLRQLWNPKSKDGKMDPYYQRKPVPDAMTHGVGETGLTKQEEYLNRERKYSVNGADVRKFSDSTKGFIDPTDDPYYGRKQVHKSQIEGVADTQMSAAEAYEHRDAKTALAEFSGDPFQRSGHRQSVSGISGPAAAAAARRRSSAVAPDATAAAEHHHHSGYDGDNRLAPVESRADDEITPSSSNAGGYGTSNNAPLTSSTGGLASSSNEPLTSNTSASQVGPTTTTTTTTTTSTAVRDDTGHHVGETGHTQFYDAATRELDNIAPHERV